MEIIEYEGVDHGTQIWEYMRSINSANSSTIYDQFIGNGAKHKSNSSLIWKRKNCLAGKVGNNTEEPSEWVVENLFKPGQLGEDRLLALLGDDIHVSSYFRVVFLNHKKRFLVGVSPDGHFELENGQKIPVEVKTNCRSGSPWVTPLMKTYMQNIFQCIGFGSTTGVIIRIEDSHEDYLDFTVWIVEYDITKFGMFFDKLIAQIQADPQTSANQLELKKCVKHLWTIPNQVYLTGQECSLLDNIKTLLYYFFVSFEFFEG